ncbi:hypothetical protein GCM10007079_17020 [Nocardiopsis terrae]|nr:hypothetical protein GCM10007079_17020 [Nocardiopsis terrae]
MRRWTGAIGSEVSTCREALSMGLLGWWAVPGVRPGRGGESGQGAKEGGGRGSGFSRVVLNP